MTLWKAALTEGVHFLSQWCEVGERETEGSVRFSNASEGWRRGKIRQDANAKSARGKIGSVKGGRGGNVPDHGPSGGQSRGP